MLTVPLHNYILSNSHIRLIFIIILKYDMKYSVQYKYDTAHIYMYVCVCVCVKLSPGINSIHTGLVEKPIDNVNFHYCLHILCCVCIDLKI